MANILIVDDDPVYGELTQQRLIDAGHTVLLMRESTGVLTDVRRVKYDVILLDVNMPGISGPLLLQALGARDRGRTKVLLNSSMDPGKLCELAKRHGADDWICKSGSKDPLLKKIAALLIDSAPPRRRKSTLPTPFPKKRTLGRNP